MKSINAQILTTNWLYQFDEVENGNSYEHGQKFKSNIKVYNELGYEYIDHLFGFILSFNLGNSIMYKDTALTKLCNRNDLKRLEDKYVLDTIRTINPKTCKEEINIKKVWEAGFPSFSKAYRLKQNWYFNDTTQQLYSKIERLTVVDLSTTNETPIFSIKINDNGKPVTLQDFKDDNFILVQRIKYVAEFNNRNISNYLLSDKHYQKNRVNNLLDIPMSLDEIKKTFEGRIDTIMTFDKETLQEGYKIVEKKTIHPDSIKKYRIVQDFYLDPEAMIIKSKLVAIGPIIENKEKISEFEVLFTIVYDDAFYPFLRAKELNKK
jgi:hypothetical protein